MNRQDINNIDFENVFNEDTETKYIDDDIETYNFLKSLDKMDVEEPPIIISSTNSYIVEDEHGKKYFNYDGTDNERYWELYSDKQKPFFQRCLRQLKDIWFSVYVYIDFFRACNNLDDINFLMSKIHNIFFTENKFIIGYYSEDNIKNRKRKNFKYNKIYRLKNRKLKI
jgi:hypothetical protein